MAETIAANAQLRGMLKAMMVDIPPQFVEAQQAVQKRAEPALQTQKTGYWMVKFPNVNDIAWGKIREVRVSTGPGKDAYSFEFNLNGKKQKMTIAIDGSTTAYTLSTEEGNPILYGIQKGKEFKVIDFSSKPSVKGTSRLKKLGKIRRK